MLRRNAWPASGSQHLAPEERESIRMGFLGNLFKGGAKVNVRSRFELLREAISGTMSTFYMARDRTTKEIVGLKILDREKTAALEARFVGITKPQAKAKSPCRCRTPTSCETHRARHDDRERAVHRDGVSRRARAELARSWAAASCSTAGA